MLVDALNRLEKLAADSAKKTEGQVDKIDRRMGLILDEFQHLLKLGGDHLEGQLRAAVQHHKYLGYVFAGSQTALITDMVTNHARPFYRLGDNLFIGPIPREEMRSFIRRGFGKLKVQIDDPALERILDLSEDVPYNVQGLARACWQEAANRNLKSLGVEKIDQIYTSLLVAMDPIYAPQWGNLTAPQQRALIGVGRYGGQGLTDARCSSLSTWLPARCRPHWHRSNSTASYARNTKRGIPRGDLRTHFSRDGSSPQFEADALHGERLRTGRARCLSERQTGAKCE
jgi:hypothetical protein